MRHGNTYTDIVHTYVYETTTVRGEVAAMAASLCTQYSIEPKVAGFA